MPGGFETTRLYFLNPFSWDLKICGTFEKVEMDEIVFVWLARQLASTLKLCGMMALLMLHCKKFPCHAKLFCTHTPCQGGGLRQPPFIF